MSSAFERLQKINAEKQKAKLELVSSAADKLVEQNSENDVKKVGDLRPETGVEKDSEIVVDHKPEMWSTTSENVVNKLTTNPPKSENVVNKLTTKKNVVDHKVRNWSTTNEKRNPYVGSVESFRTSEDFKQKIKVFCAKNGIDKQDFYRIVVDHYFSSVVDHNSESVVNNITNDDRRMMILYKTKALIINLYQKYNLIFNEKSKWTVRDDDAGQSFNNVDIRILELGILQTQANKNFSGKINSFNYYVPEIKNFIELNLPEQVIETMLEINRKRWTQVTGKSIDLHFLQEQEEEQQKQKKF